MSRPLIYIQCESSADPPLSIWQVGCIIGRGGSKINEIRQQSGAKISIAKDAHDESGERMFTITGSSEALEKALFLLYGQLEGEKEKRIQHQRQEVA
jgi:heterogeneous nuclear rnp K-like protein 2